MRRYQERLQYSPLYILVFGGLSGSLINFLATIFLHNFLKWDGFLSFFLGTLFNQLYHHIYYHIVFANRDIKIKTDFYIQFLLYNCVALGSILILWFFTVYLRLTFTVSVMLSIGCLSLLSVLIIRISHISSHELANVEYREMNDSYYNDQMDITKVSRFRAWYHSSRFVQLHRLVKTHYKSGTLIADLGCGNCLWNTDGLNVVGVDVNERMLRWASLNGRLSDYYVTDNLAYTNLPSKKFDIVVMSETLEHISNIPETLFEVQRILKDEGKFIVTVPYDIFLGPFFILFNLNCLYMGFIRGSRYHKYRCGHINHFTKKRLRNTLKESGFKLNDIFIVNGLLLYCIASKANPGAPAHEG
jgi:ubiquinone/menaquinone biosynthesis C-methylase UbiE